MAIGNLNYVSKYKTLRIFFGGFCTNHVRIKLSAHCSYKQNKSFNLSLRIKLKMAFICKSKFQFTLFSLRTINAQPNCDPQPKGFFATIRLKFALLLDVIYVLLQSTFSCRTIFIFKKSIKISMRMYSFFLYINRQYN